MPPYNRNQILNQFFKPVGRDVVVNPNRITLGNLGVRKGSLINFEYTFWRRDQSPLVVVSNEFADGKLWGVNLHYLTMPYMKKIMALSANNPAFSYLSISNDAYMKKAFRSYKWTGIKNLSISEHGKKLASIISMARSYDPAEVEIMRRRIKEQFGQQMNPKASQMTNLEGEGPPVGGE
jgi:hypothetical protein